MSERYCLGRMGKVTQSTSCILQALVVVVVVVVVVVCVCVCALVQGDLPCCGFSVDLSG